MRGKQDNITTLSANFVLLASRCAPCPAIAGPVSLRSARAFVVQIRLFYKRDCTFSSKVYHIKLCLKGRSVFQLGGVFKTDIRSQHTHDLLALIPEGSGHG